jgi:hypothetical protein
MCIVILSVAICKKYDKLDENNDFTVICFQATNCVVFVLC